jgi:uncharacterized membrane protein YhfC
MNPIFLLSGLGMMAAALVVVIDWKLHARIPWSLFGWGALAWVISIVFKSYAALPTETVMESVRAALPESFSEPVIWIYIGLLTGIFECGVTLFFAYITPVRSQGWEGVVGFGLGFGAFEALLLGLISFILILLVWLVPDKLPPDLVQQALAGAQSTIAIPAPVLERINAIFLHALSCLLIVYAVQTREWKWILASFLYKTAIDSIAGYIHITYGLENLTPQALWTFEVAILPFGIVGVWGLWKFRERYRELESRG